MYKILLIQLTLLIAACRQKGTAPQVPGPGEKFESKYMQLRPDTTRIMMIQDVVISYGDLYAESDSAFLEKPKQTVTLYGARKIIFQGRELQPGQNNDTMVYNKSDGVLMSN